MRWYEALRGLLLGAVLSCQGHTRPDPVLPSKPLTHYKLVIDQDLPVWAIEDGAQDWVRASRGALSFEFDVRSHAEAMAYIPWGRDDVIVLVDFEGTCPEEALACYQWPGVIYFRSARVDKYLGWDVVPAHEIGHAMGLEHLDEADNVMNPYVEFQGYPTHEDWLRIEALGRR